MASDECGRLVPLVLASLTWDRLRVARAVDTNSRFFFPEFGIDRAEIGDETGFKRLRALGDELAAVPDVAARAAQLRADDLTVEFSIYDEPAGHFLCVRVEVGPRGSTALTQ
jgi:hypothetical protein